MLFRWKKIDYTSPASAQGGPGVSKQITWYQGTPYIDMSTSVFTGVQQAIGASLGDVWWLGGTSVASGGNAFMFVRARAALSLGQLVTVQTPTTGTVTIPGSPVSTTAALTTNISNVAAGVNGEVGNWLWVSATGATLPQLRRIKANTAAATGNFTVAQPDYLRPNSPTDQDVFDTLPTNGDACAIIRPYNVIVNTATTVPIGVALGTVTSGNYTLIQVAGLAPILTDGTVNTAVGTPAVGIAGGLIGGFAGTATALVGTAANQFSGAGLILPQVAKTGNAAADPLYTPCYINFTGQ